MRIVIFALMVSQDLGNIKKWNVLPSKHQALAILEGGKTDECREGQKLVQFYWTLGDDFKGMVMGTVGGLL